MNLDLGGRRILITGGSQGLGAALARECTRARARVAIVGRNPERLRGVGESCGAVAIAADVSDPESAARAVEEAATALGGLDGLVNNAGVMFATTVADGSPEDWATMLATNALAPMVMTHLAIPHLTRAPFADVINISSIADARRIGNTSAAYGATKAAVARFSDSLRAELAAVGDIRVCVVRPGTINTEGYGPGASDPEVRRQIEESKLTGLAPEAIAPEIARLFALDRSLAISELTILPGPRVARG